MKQLWIVLCLLVPCTHVHAQEGDSLGFYLERYPYPFPVHYLYTTVQRQAVRIAYMDVVPARPNGRAVILLHGKNFPAAYWEGTIRALNESGFRVIAPDALGFGKSSKPVAQYSFALLASLDKQLLDTLGIARVSVLGHSMGGMLAARFALAYPGTVERLVLEDPLGLEDWREQGAPFTPVDALYEGEKKATYASILDYHRKNYYPVWKPEYEAWVKVQYSFTRNRNADQYAWVSALTTDMILSQPVIHEFPLIRVPTLLVVGKEDKTKVVRNAPDSVLQRLGHYEALGKRAAAAIPGARLIEYDGVGHVPHLQTPGQFYKDMIRFLD